AQQYQASLGDPPPPSKDVPYPVQGIASANLALTVTARNLSLEGQTLAVQSGWTLNDVTNQFAKLVVGATASEILVANSMSTSNDDMFAFFAPGQTLNIPSYVVQKSDTLANIATTIGPPPPPQADKVVQLLSGNEVVPNLFVPQLPLDYGSNTVTVGQGDTF